MLWLNSLKSPLKVGITQIPNQVLKDKKGYKGYVIDLFKILENSLGIKFSFVYYDSWSKLLEAAKQKRVDIVFLAQKTETRLKYFYFTDVVLIQHNKILGKSKKFLNVEVKDLFKKRVAVVKGSAIEEYIRYNYPLIKVYESKSERENLKLLLKDKVDFSVVEPVRTSFYMRKNNIDELYICGSFPYDYKLRIASRKDLPMLNIILNKAIDFMDPVKKKALALKWGYEKEPFLDKKLLLEIFVIFLITLIFLFYLSLLNSRLKKAKLSLKRVNETLEERIKEEVSKNREKDLAMINQSRFAQMGQAINMIAHQWRQPLNNINIIIQRIFIKCQKNSVDLKEIEELKSKVLLQIDQMSKTIDDFRNFFKPQKKMSAFSLNDMLDTVANIVDPILKKSGIKLTVTKQDKDLKIVGYSNELSQALLNIIYNAKDALVEREIENKKINLTLDIKENKAVLKIKDNAKGIKKEYLNKVFDPYFSTKGKNGTGIGLYMAKIIVLKHPDANITVYNDDEGAVFEISLPL